MKVFVSSASETLPRFIIKVAEIKSLVTFSDTYSQKIIASMRKKQICPWIY